MIKFKQTFWLLAAFLILPGILSAQRTITGTVTDTETGETLIGVNILAKGTATGTSSNIDGTYTLKLSEKVQEIEFSYTGYATQTINVGASNIIDVQMSAGTVLDEVIVIGYGTVKREDATGSIASVGAEDFNRGAITGAQELLAGKIAGVNITPSADPGGAPQIRIRGGASLTASNDPLIVIDGVPVDNQAVGGSRNFLNLVNPADIENMTVLKDASATAIYGSRASNGVILITTKKGTSGGKLAVNYNGNVSFSNNIEQLDVFTADEYRALIAKRVAEGDPNLPADAVEKLGNSNTDWQDEIYQTAISQDHNINFGGGVKGLPYRVSLGYTDKKGILKTDEFSRTTAAINLSPKFFDNTLQFNINHKSSFNENRFADRGAVGSAVSFDPTRPVRDASSPYGGYFAWTNDTDGLPITIATANPVAQLEQREDVSNTQRHIISGSTDYRFSFLPELRANLNLSYDYSQGDGTVTVDSLAAYDFDIINSGGELRTYDETQKSKLLEFYLDYKKEFGNSTFEILGGYSYQSFRFETSSYQSNLAGTADTLGLEDGGELVLASLFGRANYSIYDRVFLTATLRRDGVSRFAPENRWGLFPAAALAVKILNTNNNTPFSNLKARVGYGITGQQDLGRGLYYAYLATYTEGEPTAEYQFGDQFYPTLRPGGYDSNIKWEETTTYNAGIDFAFKNERLNGSVDIYRRISKDLLNTVTVPAGTNFTDQVTTNVGSLQNDGIELALQGIAVQGDNFTWEIGGNMAYNQNEITKVTLADSEDSIGNETGGVGGGVGNQIQINTVGFPLQSFFVFEQIYDAEGNPIEGEYSNLDGDADGLINTADKYRLEKPAPNFVYGFNTRLTYKKWSLSAAARAKTGNYVYNDVLAGATYNTLRNNTGFYSNVHKDITLTNFEVRQTFSDYYVQRADFLRIDHITLTRDFADVFNKIKNISVYATVQNPVLVTQYTGVDPEINNGIDNNIYPRSRTFLIGVNANF